MIRQLQTFLTRMNSDYCTNNIELQLNFCVSTRGNPRAYTHNMID